MGEGMFPEPVHVVWFVKCECPGRSLAPNTGMAIKLAEMKPDAIHLSSCMANAKPDCPYASAEEMAAIIKNKTGIEVTLGTHEYK
jgi:predicted metal-binding protein